MAARKTAVRKTVRVDDGLQNVVANLGTYRDKASHSTFTPYLYNPQELLNAYQSSWLAEKTIDAPAEDSTRKWRQWKAPADQIEKIEALEKSLKLKETLQDALIAARLWGGAAIYINTDEAAQDQPIKPGVEIKSLVVLTRDLLTPDTIVRDIKSPYFGKPEIYNLAAADAGPVRIHASRLVILSGRPQPKGVQGEIWGLPVLSSVMPSILRMESALANVNSLIYEAKVDVFKFKGWAEMLSEPKNDEILTRRLTLQAVQKGINGAVVIDSEDDYQAKSASFGGLPEILNKFAEDYSGASGIPFSRVYGRAAAGLSGSGEGDERTYYDRIGFMQSKNGEAMSALDECIIWQALGSRPPEVFYEWRPLQQLTEEKRAEIFSKTATALRALAGNNSGPIIPVDALSVAATNELTEQGVLPGLQEAIDDFGTLAEQDNLVGADNVNSSIGDAEPMPLYVSRRVTNAAEILKHYADQGVTNLIDPAKMHATITFSRLPVQWMKMGQPWESELSVSKGGPRVSEAFGDKADTLVLSFASSQLSWRHEEMVREGASWDWPEYHPHLSISYDFSGDAQSIKPWVGEIKFGPEIFEALDTEWKA